MKVTIQAEWIKPETGEKVQSITAYAGIVQTLSKLQIQLMTPESESCLLAHAIEPTPCGNRFNVSVVYANTPGVELRGVRSERHVGAATISTHGAKYKPDSLTAEYWTDRKTVGRMTFEGCVDKVYSRFEDARSEEHTSELKSLMRISYADFCLTQKHTQQYPHYTTNTVKLNKLTPTTKNTTTKAR